jgi:hypothetical protein
MTVLKLASALTIGFILSGCDVSHGPYLKSKVEMKPLSDNCSGQSSTFSMNSNIIGERYVFQECLHAGAVKEDIKVTRAGDSVVISFNRKPTGEQLYEITVDVNTQPRYNWLTIGNNTFPIIPTAN